MDACCEATVGISRKLVSRSDRRITVDRDEMNPLSRPTGAEGSVVRFELPAGVTVGHWTDAKGRTGCTVVLTPEGAVGGVDVRGAAAATLGTDALRPGMLIERVHAVLLTGGSAFGLAAAGGIMRFLEERGIGYPIGSVRVPIVGGAVIFDLMNGDPHARPNA